MSALTLAERLEFLDPDRETGRGAYSLFTARRDHDRFTRRGVEPR